MRIKATTRWYLFAAASALTLGTAQATYTVMNGADSGPGSLRQAMMDASINCGTSPSPTINFAGPTLVKPLTPLPDVICNGTTIDGGGTPNTSTGGDTNASIVVEIDGSMCVNMAFARESQDLKSGLQCDGLWTHAIGVTVKGVAIHSFGGNGIILTSGSLSLIGSFVGTDATGAASGKGNGGAGILANGGTLYAGDPATPGQRNLITGNASYGIDVTDTTYRANIDNNLIGGDRSGTNALSNGSAGVFIEGTSNTAVNLVSNYIRYNLGYGVSTSRNDVELRQNVIAFNGGSAYVNSTDPVSPPVIRSFSYDGTNTTVSVSTTPGALNGVIDIFSNPSFSVSATPSRIEGQVYPVPVSSSSVVNGTQRDWTIVVPGQLTFPTATFTENCDCGAMPTSNYSAPAFPPMVKISPGSSVAVATDTTLTVTVFNANSAQQITGINFAYVLPSPLQMGGGGVSYSGECGSAISATAGGFQAVDLSLSPNGQCNITVPVRSNTAGLWPLGSVNSIASSLGVGGTVSSSSLFVTSPGVSVAPPSVTFPPTSAGGSSSQAVTFVSTGSSTLTISRVLVATTAPGPSGTFTIASETCTGAGPLATGASCTVTVTFTPAVSGTFTGQLQLASNVPGASVVVPLQGTGNAPSIAVSTASLVFGSQTVGTSSVPVSLSITNGGSANLTISSIVSSAPAEFVVSGCAPVTIAPVAGCNAQVTFVPAAVGPRSATLTVGSNDPTNPAVTVSLTGTGLAQPPAVQLSPTSLTFGSQNVGTQSAPQTLVVTNTGGSTLNFTSILSSVEFPLASPPAAGDCAASLAAGASCNIRVFFTPQGTGARTNTLTIRDDASGSPRIVALAGTGAPRLAPALALSPPALGFATFVVGATSPAQTVTVTNNGTAALTFAGVTVTGDFAAGGCAGSIAPGTSCSIAVTFTPTVAGARTGALTIVSNDAASPAVVALSGSGAAPPGMALSPSVLAFGSVVVGSTSAPQNVTVTNTGGSPLTITSISTGSSRFAIAGPASGDCIALTAPLAAGASCVIRIAFAPAAPGAISATLSVKSDALGSPHTLALSGTGANAPAAIQLSASSLSFPLQRIGTTSASQNLVVTNTGGSTLSIASVTFGGADFSGGGCSGQAIAPAGSCTIGVSFTPSALGARTASIAIMSDASTTPSTVSLTGTGGASAVQLSPSNLTFVRQTVGSTSAAQSVTLTNTGTMPLGISAIAVSGDFGYSGCGFPLTLTPGTSCTFSVTFSPLSNGTLTGAITVVDNAPGSPHVLALSGTGANGPQASISVRPTSLEFGDVRIGTQHSDTVTITSNGTAPLAIASISTSGGDFIETNACPASVAIGSSCDVTVFFTATAAGARSGTLVIATNGDPATFNVALRGNGVPIPPGVLAVDRLVDFGQHVINTTSRIALQLRNSGEQPLNVTVMEARGTGFALEGSCDAIAPANACTVTLVFTPPSIGTFTGVLTVLSNDARGAIRVDLLGQGTAIPRPEIELSVDGIGFANQLLTTRSAAQRVTIRSVGSAPLHIAGISVTGPFELSGSCPLALAVGASCDVSVTFEPVATGQAEGRLAVQSDAQAGRSFASLTGTGCRFFSLAGMRSLQRFCR